MLGNMDVTRVGVWLVALAVVTGLAASKESDSIVKMSVNEGELQYESSPTVSVVFCNRTHYCPPCYTCCKTSCGKWRCCPPGYKCGHTGRYCYRKDGAGVKYVEKMPAVNLLEEENKATENRDASSTVSDNNAKSTEKMSAFNILEEENQPLEKRDSLSSVGEETHRHRVFCNRTHYCPPCYTCCRTSCGKWRCCPPGYKCGHTGMYCYRKDGAGVKYVEKMPAVNILEEENKATENRDASSTVSDNNAMPTEKMSAFNILEEENQPLESRDSLSSVSEETHRHRVFCNRTHYCPPCYTCCKTSCGKWRCCPPGYKCGHTGMYCYRKDGAGVKYVEKMPAFNILEEENQSTENRDANAKPTEKMSAFNILEEENQFSESEENHRHRVSCGGGYYCPKHYTCCRQHTGRWGCLPPGYKCHHRANRGQKHGKVENTLVLSEAKHDDVQDYINAEFTERDKKSKLLTVKQQVDANTEFMGRIRASEILTEEQHDDVQDDANAELPQRTRISKLLAKEQHGDVQDEAELMVYSATIKLLAEGQHDDGQDAANSRLTKETPVSELRDAEHVIKSPQAVM